MNRSALKQGGGNRPPAEYISPEMTLMEIRVEQGFAGSGWSEDPTIGGEHPIDPYGPDSYQSY